ncbi:hypothetical protein QTQ03_08350 [Micromonospora sp. WMMA1363]|uniref:hypothetical protein n=1 Tax=Micromonospora sp. WMMA1363 TaxID=3053985 RepID=UPI00259D1E9D|nr:hypothetical protein [Micromonospora sp. WMMA1363]MDM4719598.1 hypothetical protein [Micromonospora sp. WMMA1363]
MPPTRRLAHVGDRRPPEPVADAYLAVAEKVEALFQQGNRYLPTPSDRRWPRLCREHHRLLGNGYCTGPPELDCAFEAICETCAFFQANVEFRPTLQCQRDHAAKHHQTHRVDLFDRLPPASTDTYQDQLDKDYLHDADVRMMASLPERPLIAPLTTSATRA